MLLDYHAELSRVVAILHRASNTLKFPSSGSSKVSTAMLLGVCYDINIAIVLILDDLNMKVQTGPGNEDKRVRQNSEKECRVAVFLYITESGMGRVWQTVE